MRVLILGGYGTFGGRLVELLASDDRFELLIAGRSEARAAAFIRSLPPGAEKRPVALDRDHGFSETLAFLRPDVVVDATGPFQVYGAEPYRVVEACLAQGISYVDLADGSDFVAGIGRFDITARQRGVFLLSGVSSFPVLTAAVVRRLATDMDTVMSVTAGIAPSPYAGIGLNVIRAIASYAGQPVGIWWGGAASTAHAFTETMKAAVAPPGHLPVRETLFALVDVPDNRVLPRYWPGLRSVWIGVGPTPALLFRGLIGLAWLVRLGLLPSLSPLARLLHWACNTIRWGENRGAMFVRVGGVRNGTAAERSWHMIAEGGDGPMVPSMAAAAILRRCVAGVRPPAGARNAIEDVSLDDYEAIFRGRRIVTGVREPPGQDAPLYRRVLGPAWDALPPAIRAMHTVGGESRAEGVADIENGDGLIARLVRRAFGFPKAGRAVPVTVHFKTRDGGEVWDRSFAGQSMSSVQDEGCGGWSGLVVERFGPLAFGLAPVVERGRLRLILRRWSAFGLWMPLWLAPYGEAHEAEEDGRFRFQVEIAHPLTGLIVRYRGWLAPL
ncbi:MAG: DUF4166 domain-containing protein [Bauldia sp.]|nr:DUF4166 domain-containing protein [Bauldia sp.]